MNNCIMPNRVRAVYERLIKSINTGSIVYHQDKADRVMNFIERFCKHSKGRFAGKTFVLLPYQKAFIGAVFGCYTPEGKRLIQQAFTVIGRKNGKTTLMAAINLYLFLIDTPGAEVYTAATTYAQARILFDEALNMVKQNPALSSIITKRRFDMYFPDRMSKFSPLANNPSTLDGLNASAVTIDEIAMFDSPDMYNILLTSQSARENPLCIMITTAGTVRQSIYDDLHSYAEKVADGVIDDMHFLPLLYELENHDDYLNEASWILANPGLDKIKSRDNIRDKIKKAQENPDLLSAVLTKDFNIPQNKSSAWLTFDEVENKDTFNLDDFQGGYCIGGVDLSLCTDMTAAAILMERNGKKFVHCQAWLPEATYQNLADTKVPYKRWVEKGHIRLCSGNTINPHDVTEWFIEIYHSGITPSVVYYDPYGSRLWVDEMTSAGFRLEKAIQGAKTLSVPLQVLGADLRSKQLNYNNNPVTKFCLLNTHIQEDRNGNIVPVKAGNKNIYKNDIMSAILNCYVGFLNGGLNG